MLEKSLKDLAAGLREGAFNAATLAEEALDRQARFADLLGAYKAVDAELARAQAREADTALASGTGTGPLTGLPVSVKDLYGVRGFPTFAGTPRPLPAAWEADGPLIARLRAQAAVITGKTHTVEIAFGGIGTNPHWPTPRNPWDPRAHRVPGGSSSGAGISLAEGSAVLAMGSDTAGSVRIPASMTGMVGLKTTFGRWPVGGIFPLSPSLDTAGILTRTVADAIVAFDALDGQGGAGAAAEAHTDTALTLGVPKELFWDDCMPGVAEGVRAALGELEAKGARLVPFAMPESLEAFYYLRLGGLAAAEAYAFLSNDLPQVLESLDPNVRQRMAEAATLPAHEYIQRKRRLAALGGAVTARLAEVDAVVTPTVPITPPTMDEVGTLDGYRPKNLMALRNTCVANLLGLSALTMPVALDGEAMPVGLQLMAAGGKDAVLLGIGAAAEAVLGIGRERLGTPPLCGG